MKKRYMLPIVGAVASIGVRYMMKNKNQNDESEGTLAHSLAKAGMPDQMEDEKDRRTQLENAKMVSEGSQFGVQYFNETSEDELDEIERKIKE